MKVTRFSLIVGCLFALGSATVWSQLQFTIPITLSDGVHTQVLNVGVSPSGTDAFDVGLDVVAPPLPPSGAFDARLKFGSEDYYKDMRSNSLADKTYYISYVAASGAGPITLSWNAASLTPALVGNFTIVDDITGTLYSLDMTLVGSLNTNSSPYITSKLRISWNKGPLPITLSSFVGTGTNDGNLLKWTTVSEINNYGFYIQRKDISSSEFTDLPGVFIPGYGTSGVAHEYQYLDRTAPGNIEIEYRLRQLDLDGVVHFGNSITVKGLPGINASQEVPARTLLCQNYPNPFNPSTSISIVLRSASLVRISVFNMIGQEIATLVDAQMSTGSHSITWHPQVSSGSYLCRLEATAIANPADRIVQTRRMVLLK